MLESNILGLRKVSINVPLHFLLSPPLFLIIQTHLGTLSYSIPFFHLKFPFETTRTLEFPSNQEIAVFSQRPLNRRARLHAHPLR